MYCMKCGSAIADDQVFCASCAAAPIPVVRTQLPQKTKTVKKTVTKKKKKEVNYKAICAVLAVITAVTVVLFSIFQKKLMDIQLSGGIKG